jgi:alkylhydroperoxidase family enzyme
MHHKELKHWVESDLRTSSLCVCEETLYFSDIERATLYFTGALTKLECKPMPDKIFIPLISFFSKEEICFLILTISQSNTWNRLMKVFEFTPGNYKVSD